MQEADGRANGFGLARPELGERFGWHLGRCSWRPDPVRMRPAASESTGGGTPSCSAAHASSNHLGARSRPGRLRLCARRGNRQLHPQLDCRRRSRSLLLRQEDGSLRRGRHRSRDRAGQGLVDVLAAHGHRQEPDRPRGPRHRARHQGKGGGPGRGHERLRQLALRHVLAEELRHRGSGGPCRAQDRHSAVGRGAPDVAGAREGGGNGSGLGYLGQRAAERQAVRAQVEVDRRDHLVLQHPPHFPARAW